jgi:hypothetical protein
VNENNKRSLLVDKKSYTYLIEKDVGSLTININMRDSDLDVFQFTFVIFNLKNNSQVNAGIMHTINTEINRFREFLGKSIDIKGKFSEHDDINNKKHSLKEWEYLGEI